MLVTKLEILGDIDRRGAIRFDADSPSTLRVPDGKPIDVRVEDFSRTGFLFVSDTDLPIGTLVSLGLSGAGSRAARIVRRRGQTYGCAFMAPLSDEDIARAFKGQESVLADLSAKLDARFRAAEERAQQRAQESKGVFDQFRRWLRR
ncbi:MAG: PilZ domain-containing protein [Sphingomonadales bacterium]|nr:MAG: PilZ domain-containing protein [Sphingomonadales bacterium]